MTAVKDFIPKDYNDDPNWGYQLTSHQDQADLTAARAKAVKNIANDGSSVPQASTLRAGNMTTRATPATELSGNQTSDATVKRVDVSPKAVSVATGATTQLTATVLPASATTKTVTYASNNTAAATVNSSTGLVTGVAAGVTAKVTLTSNATNVSDNDTVTIDGRVYRFKNTLAQAYDVKIGADAATTLDNIKAAVNATGTAGTEYFAGTLVHPTVTATTNTNTTQLFESKERSTAANSIAVAKSAATYTLSGATLTGGAAATATITATTTDQGKTSTSVVTVTGA